MNKCPDIMPVNNWECSDIRVAPNEITLLEIAYKWGHLRVRFNGIGKWYKCELNPSSSTGNHDSVELKYELK